MLGLPESLSRHPQGVSGRDHWPTQRDVDAAAVETVPATVMFRCSRDIGHSAFLALLAEARPNTLPELIEALLPRHARVVQPILLNEGVSWLVTGRVVGSGNTPVAGARVTARANGQTLIVPAEDRSTVVDTTTADGRFTLRLPPGEVEIQVERAGLSQGPPTRYTVSTDGPTNGEPQELSAPIQMR